MGLSLPSNRKDGDVFDLIGNRYSSTVSIKLINIRWVKWQLQQKQAPRCLSESMWIILRSVTIFHFDAGRHKAGEEMSFYLEKFVQQEGEPICQHLLRHGLCSAR